MRSFDKTDLSDTALIVTDLAEATRRAAGLTCARNAHDTADLRELIDMLGLRDLPPRVLPLDPSARAKVWRRTQKARAACTACHGEDPTCPLCHTKETA